MRSNDEVPPQWRLEKGEIDYMADKGFKQIAELDLMLIEPARLK